MSWELGNGSHLVTVVSHVLGRSKEKNTPFVAVEFESEGSIGERITWWGYLSDAAYERTVNSLRVLGWEPADHNGLISSLNGTDILKGALCEIVVETETYEGKQRPKVKWVNPVGGGGGAGGPMSEDEATALSAQLRQKLLSAAKPTPNAKPGTAAPNGRRVPATSHAGRPDDSDLPFAPLRLTDLKY